MSERLLVLEEWAKLRFGEHAPTINTLRRWARGGKIAPAAVKHGRTYFVQPTAQYSQDAQAAKENRLLKSIYGKAS